MTMAVMRHGELGNETWQEAKERIRTLDLCSISSFRLMATGTHHDEDDGLSHWPDWDSEPPTANSMTAFGTTPQRNGRPPSTRSFDPWRAPSVRTTRSVVSAGDYGDEEDMFESAELVGGDLQRAAFKRVKYAEGSTIGIASTSNIYQSKSLMLS